MRGAVLYGPRDVRFEERPEPKITKPTDAIITISATCVCGSDLWPYRGIQPVPQPTPMGHEYCRNCRRKAEKRLADAITTDVMNILHYAERSVSVAMEEIISQDWVERVYKPEIKINLNKLYKKPG
jgi:phenylpyruvate tautomerase PptA (4-oxalocrotonate tautomerase family)